MKDWEQISNKFNKFLSMLALIYQGLFQNRTKTHGTLSSIQYMNVSV